MLNRRREKKGFIYLIAAPETTSAEGEFSWNKKGERRSGKKSHDGVPLSLSLSLPLCLSPCRHVVELLSGDSLMREW